MDERESRPDSRRARSFVSESQFERLAIAMRAGGVRELDSADSLASPASSRIVRSRMFIHIGGYDPIPPEQFYSRFVRQITRFEQTWSARVAVSAPTCGTDEMHWTVRSDGQNWAVTSRVRFVRWDDVMEAIHRRPDWQRLLLAFRIYVDFVVSGALWGYLRTNWRYAVFFLFPPALLAVFCVVAGLLGGIAARAGGSVVIGLLSAVAAFHLLWRGPGRWTLLPLALDDWIFAGTYLRRGEPVIDSRLDRLAQDIDSIAGDGSVDEIVIFGHSLGAVLGVDLAERLLRRNPHIGCTGSQIALVTAGSSILKIALHRGALRFRAALRTIATRPFPFWIEYQALTDLMNFYKTDPVAEAGGAPTGRPLVRIARISRMLNPDFYKRIRRNFYRVHCQFISGNDRRTSYDYFMLVCGPLSVECQARLPDGPASAFDELGALVFSPVAVSGHQDQAKFLDFI